MKYFGSGGSSHLDALTRQGRVCNGRVCVGLVQVETVEVESDEADLRLTLTDLNVAGRRGGFRPISEVLAVSPATFCYKITTNTETSSTGSSCGSALQ